MLKELIDTVVPIGLNKPPESSHISKFFPLVALISLGYRITSTGTSHLRCIKKRSLWVKHHFIFDIWNIWSLDKFKEDTKDRVRTGFIPDWLVRSQVWR